jgi:hypothetical protein
MKALVCLAAFLITLGSAYAIDNMVKGETFDGETGLKTGAQLEDLVTQSYWSPGAFATNNALRLFDASQFELGTDATGITGTNVATIKEGGITTTEILDGTIGTNDVNADFIALLNSDDYADSRGGFPILTLTTNDLTSTITGGSGILESAATAMFDKDFSTPTAQGALNSSGASGHTYAIDLGASYSGIAEIKVRTTTSGALQCDWFYASSHNPFVYKTGKSQPRQSIVQYSGTSGVTSTNNYSQLFSGRYIAFGVANTTTGAGHNYQIYEIAVWGVTNTYDNLGGF